MNGTIYYSKCFGTTENTGNQAVVIMGNANCSIEERLAFTKQQNQPACVFMEPDTAINEIILDYYYPHARSPLCLHATIAAGQVYFTQNPGCSKLTIITSMRRQKIIVEKIFDRIFVKVSEQKTDELCLEKKILEKLLNINTGQLVSEPVVRSVGSPKLLCEVNKVSTLNSLNPNLPAILTWSKEHQINGCYVYCKLNEQDYVGRNFNHNDPALEDAATGVAAGALTALLKRNINLYQGENLHNPCVINTKYSEKYIHIGGQAILYRHA